MKDEFEWVDADDGSFWMSFEDVIKYFVGINVCLVRHKGLGKRSPWEEVPSFTMWKPVITM